MFDLSAQGKRGITIGVVATVAAIGVIWSALDVDFSEDALRGRKKDSPDGKTYLSVMEGYGDFRIVVDGKVWPHAIGEPGAITPGYHQINYGEQAISETPNGIGFTVPEGKTFEFSYWGP